MQKRIKMIAKVIGNIAFIVVGITNAAVGVYLWWVHPLATIFLCIVSLLLIVRGTTKLMEIILVKD